MQRDQRAVKVQTSSTATVYESDGHGGLTQTWPPRPIGCTCGIAFDPDGCTPEYDMPGVGVVVPVEAYKALRHRLWRWRLRNWWATRRALRAY